MTREEAIKELKEYEDELDLEYATPFDKAILYAIKALSQEPTDAVSRILNRMWNCRGKHTTSIDKVAMEQIIRDELTSVTPKSIVCDDAISRKAVLDGLKGCICEEWVKTLFATMVKQLPSVTQKGDVKNV